MEKIRLAVLASGSGSTGEVVFDKAVVVITNNPDAGVIERAKRYDIPCVVLKRVDYRVLDEKNGINQEASRLKYGEALIEVFRKYGVDFVGQHGWSILTPENVTETFADHIINAHPAPLDPGYPDFGGQGMHGLAAHATVLNFAKMIDRPFWTEVTLHKVSEKYDKGELLAYSVVEIKEGDTPEDLQERVKEVEKRQNADFWNRVEQTGKLPQVIQRPSRLILTGEEEFLAEAKRLAIEQYPKG